jgi:hypothetical protein
LEDGRLSPHNTPHILRPVGGGRGEASSKIACGGPCPRARASFLGDYPRVSRKVRQERLTLFGDVFGRVKQKMRKALFAITVIAFWPFNAFAITGNDFLTRCNSPEPANQIWCLGFISGLSHGWPKGWLTRNLSADPARVPYCVPAGAIDGQVKDIVVRFFQRQPELRQFEVAFLFPQIMAEVYPCGRKR